jgi:alkylated DNA repair dioxygenase AlkB
MEIKTEKSFLEVKNYNNENLIKECIKDIEDKLLIKPEIKIMGKICYQKRDINFFSNDIDEYKYSNKKMKSDKLSLNLNLLLNEINNLLKTDYNSILINRYNNGLDYIGAHSDDEKEIDKSSISSLSFGATRKFRIRNKKTKEIIKDISLNSLDICTMGGDFQKDYTHEIPIEKKVKDLRYSFTFRKFNN